MNVHMDRIPRTYFIICIDVSNFRYAFKSITHINISITSILRGENARNTFIPSIVHYMNAILPFVLPIILK